MGNLFILNCWLIVLFEWDHYRMKKKETSVDKIREMKLRIKRGEDGKKNENYTHTHGRVEQSRLIEYDRTDVNFVSCSCWFHRDGWTNRLKVIEPKTENNSFNKLCVFNFWRDKLLSNSFCEGDKCFCMLIYMHFVQCDTIS